MNNSLVTISIPTYNSAKFLPLCLKAIKNQTYKNIEVNIIDGNSVDGTVKLARHFARQNRDRFSSFVIKVLKGSLLEARYEGVKLSKGDFMLILDCDQILNKDAIERAVKLADKYDMLAFEEEPVSTENLIEKLFQADRLLINAVNDLNPFTGVIMPRFFKSQLLKKAYRNIPSKIFPHTGGPDHAIVYYEAWRLSKKVSVLPSAVKHIEPNTLRDLWKKFYRWGYTSVDAHLGPYSGLMKQKERFRTGLFTKGLIKESMGSILLLILKGVAFKLGFYRAKLDILLGERK